MRERGILFNAAMVRALLAGTKTQTRRGLGRHAAMLDPAWPLHVAPDSEALLARCPFGQVGDRLWVRETFMPAPLEAAPGPSQTPWNIAYAAGGQAELLAPSSYNPMLYNYERWTPSLHMPRWASRITLEITGVRVERLQDISEDDAISEGADFPLRPEGLVTSRRMVREIAFPAMWDQINGPGSWDANPWTWVIDFRVLGTTTTSKETP